MSDTPDREVEHEITMDAPAAEVHRPPVGAGNRPRIFPPSVHVGCPDAGRWTCTEDATAFDARASVRRAPGANSLATPGHVRDHAERRRRAAVPATPEVRT